MKISITIVLFFLSLASYSQKFDGVSISGDLPTAISSYRAKGYTLVKLIDRGAIMRGAINSKDIELYLFTTPKSKKVFKAVVYFDKQTNWYTIKAEYERYFDVLEGIYGQADSQYDFFTKPYFEGDGYEMSALGLEKVTFAAYWLNKANTTVSIEISKFSQVSITYENDLLMAQSKKESESINLNSF